MVVAHMVEENALVWRNAKNIAKGFATLIDVNLRGQQQNSEHSCKLQRTIDAVAQYLKIYQTTGAKWHHVLTVDN